MKQTSLQIAQTIENQILIGGGEMGDLMRSINWANTPVGPVETWPRSLRATVNMLLNSKFGMFLMWGPELVQFYNDGYRPGFGSEGEKHPLAMGQRADECWAEIWDIIYPQIRQVLTSGEATWHEDQLVPIYRNGILEEVYWTYSYGPVFDDEGKIAGVLVITSDTSRQVIYRRRSYVLRQLTNSMLNIQEKEILYSLLRDQITGIPEDIPFCMLYIADEAWGQADLAFQTGWPDNSDKKVIQQVLTRGTWQRCCAPAGWQPSIST